MTCSATLPLKLPLPPNEPALRYVHFQFYRAGVYSICLFPLADCVCAAVALQTPGSGRDAGIKTPIKVLAEDAIDASGYYQVRPGEVMNGKYRVVSEIGRGVFSCVISCIDISGGAGKNVAIKMIKNNETMHKAALKEIEILNRLKVDVSGPVQPACLMSSVLAVCSRLTGWLAGW